MDTASPSTASPLTAPRLAPLFAPLLLALAMAAAPAARAQEADLVMTGGRIVTLDEARPEVRALAAKDGRVIALGSIDELRAHIGPATRVIDLGGRLAIPGFIEGHGHFLGVGDMKAQLDLSRATSWDEIVALVALAAEEAAPGELIRGRGWHQEKWSARPEPNVDGLPVHTALSAVSPNNPVVLVHASGHASYANARAMEMCGIDAETPDPEGGELVRDAAGAPIGAFRETASRLLARAWLAERPTDPRRLAEYARDECFAKGVTSFHDAGSSFNDIDLFRAMADQGSLGVRLYVMVREPNAALAERLADYRMVGFGDGHLTVRAIKRAIDGALGSHGAWLLEPYADLATSVGLNTIPVPELAETLRIAAAHDFQVCVHAIGDRANREVLDLYAKAFAAREGGGASLRWRIEHAQHLAPSDIPRFAELGVIAAMQGVHCTSDAPWVYARLGAERAASGAYMWRTLLDSGAVIVNGTDAPVEDLDPLASFYATVTRKQKNGDVFFPAQRLTRLEALRSYTEAAAFAAFEERDKGRLSPGMLADIVVLSRDILDCAEDQIQATKVVYTVIGGEVVYDAAR
ncbi:MAG: amidohydrolase [Planctomycetota bacterium]